MDFLKEPEIGKKDHSRYTGEGEETDVSGFAVKGQNGETQIVVYSHCNDIDKKEEKEIVLSVSGLTAQKINVEHYRIDAEHSNAYAEWVRQGQPLFPEGEQYDAIKKRDGLEKLSADAAFDSADGSVELKFTMPTHGVSYLVIK